MHRISRIISRRLPLSTTASSTAACRFDLQARYPQTATVQSASTLSSSISVEPENSSTQVSEALATDPIPSTAHSLPMPGGDTTREERSSLHTHILSRLRRAQIPQHAILHPADIAPAADAVFVGVGLQTNWPGLLAALDARAFDHRRVIAVRDVFDRSPQRECLSDWFAIIADDVVAVDASVVRAGPLERRFVNVYECVSQEDKSAANLTDIPSSLSSFSGSYRIIRNDVDLVEFLHSTGWRVVPVDSKEELHALRDGYKPIPRQQSTNHVLACAPTAFSFNEGAAIDNHFMNALPLETRQGDGGVALRRKVLTEFANLHARLVDRKDGAGALVHLFTHEDWHNTPDACFPNNTFSTHTNLETGDSCVLVLYPMKDESRRTERRLVQRLLMRGRYTQIYDLTREETSDKPAFLEGTGSMVLDRVNRISYVALSQRSDLKLARAWGRVMGYHIVPFLSVDKESRPIYHTNVMMAVGTRVAVVCGESIVDERERQMVMSSLRDTGHDVVDISYDQVGKFCGNVIELESFYGEQVMVMSSAAHSAFNQSQKEQLLNGVARLVHADISTIEKVGGGGVRCTIAELF